VSDIKQIVNDFSIQVATVNGSGSQSANSVLLRSIFRMGIPVSGKNLFPSNIAGLPTWYTIRVSKHGWVARKTDIDILIAMNAETAREDVLSLGSGGAVIYDESLKLNELRADLTYYAVPFDQLAATTGAEAKLRKLIKNMVYVGVAAKLLSIDMESVEKTVRKQFAKKVKAAELNLNAVRVGYDYASSTLTKQDPYSVEPMNATEGKIIIDGNAAAAMGAMFAGVTVVPWYPITPSSSVVENLIDLMKRHRVDADGKASFAIVQAEDELAAIGMVLGAGWAGARAMTASSGPGISLMAEFAGLGYYAEIPGVIFDVQRTGPSTGLPTRTSQADLAFVAGLSHGDTKHVILLPATGFLIAHCREQTIRRQPTSRVARAITRRRCTRSVLRTTRTTCCAWRGSSRPPRRWFRSQRLRAQAKRRWASSRSAPPTGRSSRAATRLSASCRFRPTTFASARSHLRRKFTILSPSMTGFTWWNKTATPRC
jgi:2-oxoglutarate ferredoxin oxidoreductase subunit alpha